MGNLIRALYCLSAIYVNVNCQSDENLKALINFIQNMRDIGSYLISEFNQPGHFYLDPHLASRISEANRTINDLILILQDTLSEQERDYMDIVLAQGCYSNIEKQTLAAEIPWTPCCCYQSHEIRLTNDTCPDVNISANSTLSLYIGISSWMIHNKQLDLHSQNFGKSTCRASAWKKLIPKAKMIQKKSHQLQTYIWHVTLSLVAHEVNKEGAASKQTRDRNEDILSEVIEQFMNFETNIIEAISFPNSPTCNCERMHYLVSKKFLDYLKAFAEPYIKKLLTHL